MSMPGSACRKSTWRTEVRRGASNPEPSSPQRFLQAATPPPPPPPPRRRRLRWAWSGSPRQALRATRCWRSPGAAPPPGRGSVPARGSGRGLRSSQTSPWFSSALGSRSAGSPKEQHLLEETGESPSLSLSLTHTLIDPRHVTFRRLAFPPSFPSK